ncbi:hypothetical protein O181_078886 [Austropuccinia psidii MF-1]|uniref:Uncharacterized protein n=1 Tax=Austropuccinia psidii MF-1 TaxID=1389203 RepID=A0A9Q3IDG3_9BASI|nr:hypothetical protein [Austropuccinia psidii MF-1]
MSEFMIHRNILRQCGGDLEHDVKSRTTEQSSAEDIINILEEVTTRTRIGSSRVNFKTRFNTPWKDSVDKNPKENSDNMKYKSADIIRKFHICQSTTNLANSCPINEAFFSFVGKSFLKTCVPNFQDQVFPIDCIKFNTASNPMRALGIFETTIRTPHLNGNLIVTAEFFVLENYSSTHFIFRNDYLIMYGIDLANNKDRYFTIEEDKHQKFAFLPFKRQITVNKLPPVNLELEKFKSEKLNESEISVHLTGKQEGKLSALLYDHKEAFASDKKPLGAIVCHEVSIILNIERPYPEFLRRTAYPASPKSREAMAIHIKEILELGEIRKFGHNE